MFWAADAVFWLALIALFFWAARRWAAHPYRSLWLAYMFFWLADLQWIRLPYWAIGFGWLALGVYFGLYMPVFIGLSRFAVHRLRLPVILVAPVIWTGLELAQAHLLSGMTMGCLEHTQYRWTGLIQVSDITGGYGVTFLMMFVAACWARMLPSSSGNATGGESRLSDDRLGKTPRRGTRPRPNPLPSSRVRQAGEGTRGRWAFWPLAPAAGFWPRRWLTAIGRPRTSKPRRA